MAETSDQLQRQLNTLATERQAIQQQLETLWLQQQMAHVPRLEGALKQIDEISRRVRMQKNIALAREAERNRRTSMRTKIYGGGMAGPGGGAGGAGGKGGGAPAPKTAQQKAIEAWLPKKKAALDPLEAKSGAIDVKAQPGQPPYKMTDYKTDVNKLVKLARAARATMAGAAKAEGTFLIYPDEPVPFPVDPDQQRDWAKSVLDALQRAIGDEENILKGAKAVGAAPTPPPGQPPVPPGGGGGVTMAPGMGEPPTPTPDTPEADKIRGKLYWLDEAQKAKQAIADATASEEFGKSGDLQRAAIASGGILDKVNGYLNAAEGVSSAGNENTLDGVIERVAKAIVTEQRMMGAGGPGGPGAGGLGGRGMMPMVPHGGVPSVPMEQSRLMSDENALRMAYSDITRAIGLGKRSLHPGEETAYRSMIEDAYAAIGSPVPYQFSIGVGIQTWASWLMRALNDLVRTIQALERYELRASSQTEAARRTFAQRRAGVVPPVPIPMHRRISPMF